MDTQLGLLGVGGAQLFLRKQYTVSSTLEVLAVVG